MPYESAVGGKAIVDIKIPSESLVVLISRDDQFIIPNGSTAVEGGDVLLVLADHKSLGELQGILKRMRH